MDLGAPWPRAFENQLFGLRGVSADRPAEPDRTHGRDRVAGTARGISDDGGLLIGREGSISLPAARTGATQIFVDQDVDSRCGVRAGHTGRQ